MRSPYAGKGHSPGHLAQLLFFLAPPGVISIFATRAWCWLPDAESFLPAL